MSNETMLVVEVHRPSAISLPPAKSHLVEEKRGLLLVPGENPVSEGYWKEVKKNPAVKIWLRAEYLSNKGPGKAKPLVDDWNKITIAKAKALIEKIKDADMVRKIKSKAGKKGLRDVCDARIDELLADAEEANG